MGQKVHPTGFRLGINKPWRSNWYSKKQYREFLLEDAKIRRFLVGRMENASVSGVDIERAANRISITVHTAKPGVVIGRGGKGVEEIRKDLEKGVGKEVHINVEEIRQPELDAFLVAESIAFQLSRRASFRRAMRTAVQRTMKVGAGGVKVTCSGRLGGSEMARTETVGEGKVPRHTLRADIDYGFTAAKTTAGNIGVKVWIYKGEILPVKKVPPAPRHVEPLALEETPVATSAAAPVAAAPGPVADPVPVAETPAVPTQQEGAAHVNA
ncbi:MAG: 30S ribosomal protein S3 [Armatimonadetes bacterium CG_4_10_14_3_um_filter_66_18]|nr:30S ribosomal protein S3 [Armatimonadota bacterium]OIO95677.1 MAG: 30S ribosomal protein S3 [Armatimonadetes bacterium CG2_30_66_41]PIU94068.1 MAG: 30S ribosomal protein S3 [Armatimonadetes bacterium CG06_land_8_20_14_3_00_66_21]PIX43076.1 MAG: 30S ribosomal protein S3 [Armatimonadetes bacterium CG_4_8_14_3_um_filter_66_20]PIY36204.1 MAG: 30S ribosomal protein S3 [Armatimonadetes bacterium CG_4_10_14_3_um_filter_66_18]PIZ50387.1 MAG: 30S ribosomal protein S3 [Armatimonadetes bacterium CG_4_